MPVKPANTTDPVTGQKGSLVAPAWPTCRLEDVAAFHPGVWNGKDHDAAFVKALVDNFKKYSSGPTPYYRPYVSLNHKDELQSGFVSGARLKSGSVLSLDADDVPEPVGKWRAAGAIRQPSIEYFEPVYDEKGKLVDGFRKPDGSIETGPVLKALTLLGADSPGVKGLPELPFAKYSHTPVHPAFARGARVRRFSNSGGDVMDRAAMIAALQALNMDVSGITDAVPDEVLKAFLTALQATQGTPAAPAPDAVPPVQMADTLSGAGNAIVPATAPAIPGVPSGQPSKVTLQFTDKTATKEWVDGIEAQLNRIIQTNAAVVRQSAEAANVAKFADVTAFVTALATPDAKGMVKIQPAQRAPLVALLMKCDNVTVRKFADGKKEGSELAEMKAQLAATLPPYKLGDKMPDPQRNEPGAGPGVRGHIDPERRQQMLAATPQGRAVLAAEKAKKTA